MGKSVLQDWVTELPLREQGTLITGIRGCDLVPKYPPDSPERRLVAFLRYCIMNPADAREVDYETFEEMVERLSEDRIAKRSVVS